MELKPGARLGSYEIVSPLGSGGMGDVYRARDTKLGRDVAVKVLPPSVALDAGRLARFEQEARAAGALSHPNLVTVHELGVAEGSPYIVMELLEGETLRSRLSGTSGASRTTRTPQGSSTPGGAPPPGEGHPLAVRKSLDYAAQIASGLAAAHEKGIVHRDLKPENIVIEPDGRLKILDFGLAKVSASPRLLDGEGETGVAAGTAPGTVLGTVGYMSPEQVRGEEADHRSDIFALGAILYEMLTGRRAFRGATSVDTLHAILRDDPPDLLPAGQLPGSLARLVQRCLEKSPGERFQSARDLAFSLADLSSGSGESALGRTPAPSTRSRRWIAPTALALAALCVGLGLGWLAFRTPLPPPLRFGVLTYSGTDVGPAASPDGKTIAFSSARTGVRQIWLKQVNGGGETALTAGPRDTSPRFSPDGSTLLFQRASNWYRVAVLGGNERRVLENAAAADWSPDGSRIGFIRTMESSAVVGSVKADGTDPRELATLNDVNAVSIRWSPDGRWLACLLVPLTGMSANVLTLVPADGGDVLTLSTPAGARAGELNRALTWNGDSRQVLYVNQAPGAAGGTVIAHDVRTDRSQVLFSILGSTTTIDVLSPGVLLFDSILQAQSLRAISTGTAAGGGSVPVKWLTRGRSIDRQPAFSPDGGSIIFASNRAGNLDLWSLSTRDGTLRRLTDDAASDWDPTYTPDGEHIVWSSDRSGHYEIWMASDDGGGARQVSSDGFDAENPTVTPDGQWIVYASAHAEKRGIWKVRPDGGEATRIASGQFTIPEVSPDGRFVAFLGDDLNGRREILVHRVGDGQPVPFTISVERRGTLDNNYGRLRWMPDGKALAFLAVDGDGAAGVFVQDFAEGVDTASTRRRLAGFDRDAVTESFGISPDGSTVVISGAVFSADVLVADGVTSVVKR